MKICTKCNISKKLDEFPKNNRFKDGFNCICKTCINIINTQYRLNNKEKFSEMRKRHYAKNIEKMRKIKLEYTNKHKDEKQVYDTIYRELNKDKIKKYKKEWEILNKDNPIFKIKRNLRRRVHHALKGSRKANKTFELIGCTPLFFKEYIESLFQNGMTWDNYGEWHIDHIIPCYTFDLSNPEEQLKCFHYLNQRPLWAKENLKRSKTKLKE